MNDISYTLLSKVLVSPISGKRPSGGVSSDTEGVPSIGGENILVNGGMTYEELKKIPISFFKNMPKGKLLRHDVLINKDGAQTGKVGLYEGEFDEAAVNEHVFILRARDQLELNQNYLYYCVLLTETRNKIERRITGSAQPGLNSSFVNAVDIPLCSIVKQEKITTILTSIDTAIEKTESLIAKYQKIKAGLMHDLFTRGVTADGKLRPPREQTPELYQDTPIGWIPVKWQCEQLQIVLSKSGGYLQTGPFGSQLHADEYTDEGTPVVMPQDINNEMIELNSIARIPEQRANMLSRHRLKVGDITIARRGDLSRAAAVSEREANWVCGTGCFLLRLGRTDLNHFFFSHAYRYDSIQRQIAGIAVGSTMPSLNNSVMNKLFFPVPSPFEQKAISQRLDAMACKITSEQNKLEKLKKQKAGLMQDLLTGKVPVKIDVPGKEFA